MVIGEMLHDGEPIPKGVMVFDEPLVAVNRMTEVDSSRLRSLSARQLIAALEEDGVSLARQKWSHRHHKHHDGHRITTSFHHSSDTFRPKTLRSMIET